MTIQLLCPTCNARLSVPEEQAGRQIACSACGGAVSVFNPNVEEFDIDFDAGQVESNDAEPADDETDA